MKLNKSGVERLLKMDDKMLWTFIRTVAAQSGAELPETVAPEEMARLRQAASLATDKDLAALTDYLKKSGGRP
ncbi:MAG: hypothetical protein IJR89_06510 [Clostridia bacterium]|nr:hypothetical protein [Clostridia bacterium]